MSTNARRKAIGSVPRAMGGIVLALLAALLVLLLSSAATLSLFERESMELFLGRLIPTLLTYLWLAVVLVRQQRPGLQAPKRRPLTFWVYSSAAILAGLVLAYVTVTLASFPIPQGY